MYKIVLSFTFCVFCAISAFSQEHVIDQLGRKFIPAQIKVKVGDTLRFTNSDPFAHNAYTDDVLNEFDTGMQSTGKSAVVPIKAKGTFNVNCMIHPEMILKVTVD
ncbi:MAG: plastocyanin/azurin family copper-binding protein [Arcobacteraceae bacterium]|jgi:plastocyanin|nr:plastocyanin/azurin family copper-binding protein [Arcobacteraceae bacterium]